MPAKGGFRNWYNNNCKKGESVFNGGWKEAIMKGELKNSPAITQVGYSERGSLIGRFKAQFRTVS